MHRQASRQSADTWYQVSPGRRKKLPRFSSMYTCQACYQGRGRYSRLAATIPFNVTTQVVGGRYQVGSMETLKLLLCRQPARDMCEANTDQPLEPTATKFCMVTLARRVALSRYLC